VIDFDTFFQVVTLYSDYTDIVDNNNLERWPELFLDECTYKVIPRENYDQGLPLATLAFESKGMLKDRVYGVRETLFYDPYYQCHIVGLPCVKIGDDTLIEAEANFAVLRTKYDQLTEVYITGRYIDKLRRTPDGLKFEQRLCVFDTEMVPNSIIYPI
jgi:salicylate 5-hydroxylase small subunit